MSPLKRALSQSESRPDSQVVRVRADALFEAGRFREAIAAYLQAGSGALRDATACDNLGWSNLKMGDAVAAERWFREALVADGNATAYGLGLATALQAQQRFAPALSEFERVLACDPNNREALMGAGYCRMGTGEVSAAEALFRAATTIDGGGTDAWIQLGMVLERQGRSSEALAAFEAAWRNELAGLGGGDSFVNLAIALRDENRVGEALSLFERNLPHAPSPYGDFVYAMALLSVGRFREGWHAYESRWMTNHFLARRPQFVQPPWSGQELRGKTILLRAEQGLGDTIQFARYARLLRAQGARVVMKVHDGFESFARGFAEVDRVFDFGEAPAGFDCYAHLMSLPRIFGTDVATIPAHVPYVAVDPEYAARWSARIGTDARLRVGVVWAGGAAHPRDRLRSLPLEALAPLSHVAGVRWFGLQKGPREGDARHLRSTWTLDDLGAELADFSDTAAAISALDLVISVDTAVAHLAGALGKPVWLLLPTPADFRWMAGRDDSPWYPTMRLFRQAEPGAWSEVIARVESALADAVAAGLPHFQAELARPLVSVPTAVPREVPRHRPRFSAVAETRHGIMQYLPDEPDIGDALGCYGEWLQLQLEWWSRLLRPGTTILEVGAGVGAHALWTSRAIGPEGHLILSEPVSLSQRLLRQNLAANGVTNATVLRELQTIGRTTVDDLKLDRLDFLKLNLSEGVLDVLAGAEQALWQLRPILCLAVTDDASLARLADTVMAHGYRCGWRPTPLFNPANFNRRQDDVFAGRAIMAVIAIPEELDVERAFEGGKELS